MFLARILTMARLLPVGGHPIGMEPPLVEPMLASGKSMEVTLPAQVITKEERTIQLLHGSFPRRLI